MPGTIVWYRNDLRLDDQPALGFAAAAGEAVVPVFCWHPEAAGRWAPGGASRWWLHRSLASLDASLVKAGSRLVVRAQDPALALVEIAKATGATAVAFNRRLRRGPLSSRNGWRRPATRQDSPRTPSCAT